MAQTDGSPFLHIGLVTLFPEMFGAITDYGVTGRAVAKQLVSLKYWNPRDFTKDVHRTVDDRPYGGGPGMVMKPEPLKEAIACARSADKSKAAKVIYLSPQGKRLKQKDLARLCELQNIVLVCGRYEGVDERVVQSEVDEEWSIGDYVLSGGELPAMVMIDALIRLIPGALGHQDSAAEDSFSDGLLDYPHYTRPDTFAGQAVPKVLMGGNHEHIRLWRLKQSLGRTWRRRPDLLEKMVLSDKEQKLLDEFKNEES